MWYIYVTLFSWFCLEIYYFLEKRLWGEFISNWKTKTSYTSYLLRKKNYLSEWLTLSNRMILKNSININQFTVTFNLVNRIHHGILPYIYLDIKSHLGFFFSVSIESWFLPINCWSDPWVTKSKSWKTFLTYESEIWNILKSQLKLWHL